MVILKGTIIDNFLFLKEQLEQIQHDLLKGNTQRFQQIIVSPIRELLVPWIKQEYPSLQEQEEDILSDVFRKFQKKFTKTTWSQNKIDVGEEVLSLTEKECDLALPKTENTKKNLGLTRKEFKRLLKELQAGKDTLIEQVYLLHFNKCVQYLVYQCGSNQDDAYSATMEALLEIRKDLINEKIFYGNLGFYFTKRAKSKLYKIHLKRKNDISTVELEGIEVMDQKQIEDEMIEDELKALVLKAFEKLCGDCQQIIRLYYYEDQSLKEIAEKLEKSHQAIRKQATRCRDKLRNHLGEKFYQQFSSYL